MPFPQNVDFDKLASHAIWDVFHAVHGWLAGRPCDETAFINRVTENLARRRRGCDVGATASMRVAAREAILHRRGQGATDRYGSDFAVTFYTDAGDFVKTVFFQVKKSQDYRATFATAQLKEAGVDPRIRDRSYVLAADEIRAGLRIAKASDILAGARAGADSVTTRCADWSSLIPWLLRWLSCEEGPTSDPSDRNAVEPLLQNFVAPGEAWDSPWRANPIFDLPENYLPTKAWMAFAVGSYE